MDEHTESVSHLLGERENMQLVGAKIDSRDTWGLQIVSASVGEVEGGQQSESGGNTLDISGLPSNTSFYFRVIYYFYLFLAVSFIIAYQID